MLFAAMPLRRQVLRGGLAGLAECCYSERSTGGRCRERIPTTVRETRGPQPVVCGTAVARMFT
jgi:hypothetical protein